MSDVVLRVRAFGVRSIRRSSSGLFASRRAEATLLLRQVCFELREGEVVLLLGPSGSGKSLLSRTLVGLEGLASPTLSFAEEASLALVTREGEEIEALRAAYPRALRGRIGYMFQYHALFESLSVRENIELGRDQARVRWRAEEFRAWYGEAAQRLGVAGYEQRAVAQLSGGQRQRVALLRALASRPELLIYDEPTSGLDPRSAGEAAALIKEALRDPRVAPRASLVVTHDLANLLAIADRALLVRSDASVGLFDLPDDAARAALRDEARAEMERFRPRQGEELARSEWKQHVRAVRWRRFSGALSALRTLVLGAPAHIARNARWHLRFGRSLFRDLLVDAVLFLALGGLCLGLVMTHFALHAELGPLTGFVEPLLLDGVIEGLGLAFFAVICPLFASILLAARSGASAAGRFAQMRLSSELDALLVLGLDRALLLGLPAMAILSLAFVLLDLVAFACGTAGSAVAALFAKPLLGFHTWQSAYFHNLGSLPFRGTGELLSKLIPAGLGCGLFAYRFGTRELRSASEANGAITRTLFAAILWILIVFFAVIAI
ncbi:MAG: ATP-binding cassette domain-containing protein [Planctomycetes bacterium]|nr:ATP-binding cassette domain-containing protein [Planctomycetota bacterium]